MNNLSFRIKSLRSEIDNLSVKIANATKDETFDQAKLKEMRSRKVSMELELSRLVRQQWEETYERLDLDDDR
jgi:RNase P/RNase MRP subunit p30